MFKALTPDSIAPPLAPYSHGILVPEGMQLIYCAGQVGVGRDGSIPEGCAAQAEIAFEAIAAILREGGMDFGNVIKLTAYVSAREHMRPYMDVRNRLFREPYPASTLLLVGGFSREELVVEVEAIAAGPA